MDASASTKQGADVTNVFNYFLQLDDTKFSKPINYTNVRKYTKLPDFDFDGIGEAVTVMFFFRCFP